MTSKMLLIICLLFSVSVCAQVKLTGKLVDEGANPVSYASVALLALDSTIYSMEVSKKDGSFLFSVTPGNYILKITMLGKSILRQSVQLSSDKDLGDVKVNLVSELKEVVVSGQKPVIYQDLDKLIFNVENSPLKKGYNGLDVLARSPMLQVNAEGGIILRNKVPTVYINGRQLQLSGQALVSYLSGLNAEMIKSIEVQTTGSAETDASATGGIVNIILKKPARGFTSNITTSYTYRPKNVWSDYAGVNTNYGSAKWNMYSKIGYAKDNDFGTFHTTKTFQSDGGTNVADGSFRGNKQNVDLLSGIVFYPNKRSEFGGEFYYNNSRGKYVTNEMLAVNNQQLQAVSNNNRVERFKNHVWYGSVNYNYILDSLGSTLKFIGDVGRNKNVNNNATSSDYTMGNFPSSLTVFNINPVSNYYIFQSDLSKKYKKDYVVRTGLKFSSVNRNNAIGTSVYDTSKQVLSSYTEEDFANTENVSAAYIILTGKLSRKSNFRVGVRSEYTDFKGYNTALNKRVLQHYLDFFPRLYYGYTLKQNKTISLSYFRSIQRPSFRDLNPFITKENDYSYIQGNPNLKPQYTNSLNLSYQTAKQTLSLYANNTDHLIAGVYSNTGNITYYMPMNFGKQYQVGADYNYYGDVTKWLYTNSSIGAYYYKFENGPLHPSQFSFTSRVYARFKLSKTWSADVLNVYNSRFQSYVINAAHIYRMDLSLQKDFLKGKATMRLAVNDLFNTLRDKSLSTYEFFTLDFYQKRITRSYTILFAYNLSSTHKVKNKAIDAANDVRGRL